MKKLNFAFIFLIIAIALVSFGCPEQGDEIINVNWINLEAKSPANTATTTELILTFDNNPASLSIDNITVTNASKVALTGEGNVLKLAIDDITVENGEKVTVTLNDPAGYKITPSARDAVIEKGDPTEVNWTGLTANGEPDAITTTELTLTFDEDPASLSIFNITVEGATKVSLTGEGTTRKLTIKNVTVDQGDNVTVELSKQPAGYTIAPASRTVAINKAPRGKFVMRNNITTHDLVKEMGIGINLGNTFEAQNSWTNNPTLTQHITSWGAPVPTQAHIQGYADAGFSSLRIPVRWENLMGPNNTIHGPLLDKVEEVVNWTIDAGMIALINTHHESWLHKYSNPDDYEWVKQRYIDVWTQISERFKDYGDLLIFENMNEIGFGDIWSQWGVLNTPANKTKAFGLVNELNQIFVDVVRSSGGHNPRRHLCLNVYDTGGGWAYDSASVWPNDDRYALSIHYYSPPAFAILSAGEDAGWAVGVGTWGTQREINSVINDFNVFDRDKPVILGEYAPCGKGKNRADLLLWVKTVAEEAYRRGMCPMLWDVQGSNAELADPGHGGLEYNRRTGAWKDNGSILDVFRDIESRYPNR